MTAGMWIAVLAAGAGGCKNKTNVVADGRGDRATGTASGGATLTATGATAMSPEQAATWYATCWGHFNDHAWDAFKACYAVDAVADDLGDAVTLTGADAIVANAQGVATAFPDGKGEPQLTLVNGTHVASITLFTGTHDGPLKNPGGDIPATNHRVGVLMAHLVDVDAATGKATREWSLIDRASLMSQLQSQAAIAARWAEQPVVIAKGDDAEQPNVAAYRAALESGNKYGSATVKGEATTVWGAGDYVVAVGTFSGTSNGTPFTTGYVEIDQFKAGKVIGTWRFINELSIAGQLGPPR